MKVTKRDGKKVEFNKQKIQIAILKAFLDVDGEETRYAKDKAQEISNLIEAMNKDLTIEEIQDIIVKKLMSSTRKDVAAKYVEYRFLHKVARDEHKQFLDAIEEKLTASNVKNQNANVDEHSFGGRMGEMGSAVAKKYALDHIVSKMSRDNHINNMIYIHDLDSYAIGSHNCYLRTTKFITTDGIKTFEDFEDGDIVTILAKDGKWRDSTIHFYGRQPMYEIDLTRCGKTKTVVATKNHRWFLADGSITENLQIGDKILPLTKMETPTINTKREAEMFAFGFVLGDGYDHNGRLEVKFCTKEKEEYIPYFEQAGYHIGYSDGYPYAVKRWIETKQNFLDHQLWRILSFEDKQALFYGYLSADGSKTTNTKYIWTSDTRLCKMIEDISCLSGYHIFKKKEEHSNTNYSKGDRVLYHYVLTTKYSNNSTWTVTRIAKGEHRNKDYEAWCLEEPVTHSFTLEGGIVTGNCLTIPFDKLLANGFNTRQADIRPANSVGTAFQLVAVLFQLQSLQQFGGVSASHLDWTMVPYVRKSFYKHYADALTFLAEDNPDGNGLNKMELPDEYSLNEYLKFIASMPSIEDIYFTKFKHFYKYALTMTERELRQAVEAMYHNLNTLQSRSGNQLN